MFMSVLLTERPLATTEFSDWLKDRLDERGIDTSHFAAYTGKKYQTASRWVTGESRPEPENCQLIADVIHRDVREVMARAGYLKLESLQLEAFELIAKLSQVEEKVERAGEHYESATTELRQVREEVERWRERLPSPPESP